MPASAARAKFSSFGAVDYHGKYVTTVFLRGVLQSRIAQLAADPDVAFVEKIRLAAGTLDIASRNVKVRASAISPGIHEGVGYTGAGVTIAVLDSGVDDAVHESLPASKFVAGHNTTPMLVGGQPVDGNPDDHWFKFPSGHGTPTAGVASASAGLRDRREALLRMRSWWTSK